MQGSTEIRCRGTYKSRYGLLIALLVWLCPITCLRGNTVKAAEPKVMVTDYDIGADSVVSGQDFDLRLTVRNTANKKIKNMKVSVISEEGELLPASGAGTAYVSELTAEEERELIFDMKAASGLLEKSYKLSVQLEYEDIYGASYTVEDIIYIPVSQNQRLSVTDILTDDSVKVGDEMEITAMINNLGEGTLYNVYVSVEGEHITGQTNYIGNIESGKSGSVDVITKTIKAADTGAVKSQDYLYVFYEDKQGNEYEKRVDLYFSIEAASYDNLEILKEPEDVAGLNRTTVLTIVTLMAAVLVIILAVLKRRKKKKLLEEF